MSGVNEEVVVPGRRRRKRKTWMMGLIELNGIICIFLMKSYINYIYIYISHRKVH